MYLNDLRGIGCLLEVFNLLCNKNSFIIEVILDNSPASRRIAADACFATCNIRSTSIRNQHASTCLDCLGGGQECF